MNIEFIPKAEASVQTLVYSVNRVIINPLITVLFALALVYFLYGVAQFIMAQENEEMRNQSKTHMLWGIIGLFIMISVFGILNLIVNTLGVSDIPIPN